MSLQWQGTVVMQGMPAFAAEAEPAGTSQTAVVWSVLPPKIETSARVDASALKAHLENLLRKKSKWSVWLATFRGGDESARNSCRSWCCDERSKKVAVAELGESSRLFFISPLATPRDIIPQALLGDGSRVPREPTCLLGVVAQRLHTPNQAVTQRSHTQNRSKPADGGTKRDGKDTDAGKPAQKRQRKRTRAKSDVLPLSTVLTEGLDLCALLDHRLATHSSAAEVPVVVDFDKDVDDSKPKFNNVKVGTEIEIFWEGDGWYLASVSKKTSRGLLLHYIRTDEFEFVPKASLAEYARSEQLRFPQGASSSEGLSTDPNEMEADSLGHSAPPKPQRKRLEPPAEFACGDVEMCKNGKLPSMASNMPTIESLRTWKKECQLAFWHQRRTFWNGKKLSLLQQACRKHDVYPGGDVPDLKDRLLLREFTPELLTSHDVRKEGDDADDSESDGGGDDGDDSDDSDDELPVFTLLAGRA